MDQKAVLQVLGTTGLRVALFSDDDVGEKSEQSPVRLPPRLWERLTRIAQAEEKRLHALNPNAKKVSRNDVIKKVLSDFADNYEAEEARAKGSKKGH